MREAVFGEMSAVRGLMFPWRHEIYLEVGKIHTILVSNESYFGAHREKIIHDSKFLSHLTFREKQRHLSVAQLLAFLPAAAAPAGLECLGRKMKAD